MWYSKKYLYLFYQPYATYLKQFKLPDLNSHIFSFPTKLVWELNKHLVLFFLRFNNLKLNYLNSNDI